MAIWQFECSLTPLAVDLPDADVEADWDRQQLPAGYEAVIDSFTARATSWSDAILMWGEESGDRVEVVLDAEKVAAVIVRIDLRAFSDVFATGVLRLAAFCGCRLRDRTGRVFAAEWPEFVAALQASDELRFVRNPHDFLAELSTRVIG